MSSNFPNGVAQTILSLFQSGDGSDLIIRCQDRQWSVHRLIVCSRSGFFDKACKPGFEEGESGVINLHEIDVPTVERMLSYLYTDDYATGFPNVAISCSRDSQISAELKIHVAMYAAGDRFLIPSLKEVAKSHFEFSLQDTWPIPDFKFIVDKVFTSTPAADRGFRDSIVPLCVSHITDIVRELSDKTLKSQLASSCETDDADGAEEGEVSWAGLLAKNGILTAEILSKVVHNNEEELRRQREVNENLVAELHKTRQDLKHERDEHKEVIRSYARYQSQVNEMMIYGTKAKPCACNVGYKVHFTKGTRYVPRWLRLKCVQCGAQTPLRPRS